MLSVRLVCADSYQASPITELDPTFSEFRGNDIKHVPIIRIFGITSAGKKVCLHVHGVFPYMYVPYSGEINADALAYRLAASLDSALNISLGSTGSTTQHVFKIQQVSGIPFYGYHPKRHHFLKIYFYNPAMMKRATDLLQSGSVLNQSLQPHEAHIPFVLQFMIDFNVYGMSFINLASVKHRYPNQNLSEEKSLGPTLSINEENIKYLPPTIVRQSTCELEIDASGTDILNRQEIDRGIDMNPGIAAIWEEERARRLKAGLEGGKSQLVYPSSPQRPILGRTSNDVYQENRLLERLLLISQGDESLLPFSRDTISSYPIQVRDDSALLNASHLTIHVGPNQTRTCNFNNSEAFSIIKDSSSPMRTSNPPSQELSTSYSFLSESDLNLVDVLDKLAEESDKAESESVDDNSILGSQHFELALEPLSDIEEVEEPDLNLTSFQLDSMSPWEYGDSNHSAQPKSESTLVDCIKKLPNVPQLDGMVNNSSSSSSESDLEQDVTVERHEVRICAYNPCKKSVQEHVVSTTPKKRKVSPNTLFVTSAKRKSEGRNQEDLQKTPRRSTRKLMDMRSPSARGSYSPLNVVITSPKTQQTRCISPGPSVQVADRRISPSTVTTPKRSKLRETFLRGKLFSPVQESNSENLVDDENLQEPNLNEETPKSPLNASSEARKRLEFSDKSDETLVAASDDSQSTIVQSSMQQFEIINDSDSNDTQMSHETKGFTYDSDLSSMKSLSRFSTIAESKDDSDVSDECNVTFTQFIETQQKISANQNMLSKRNEVSHESDKIVIISPKYCAPSPERIVETMQLYGIAKHRNIDPFFGDENDVMGQKEVAHKMVTVKGKGLASLSIFRSQLEDRVGIDRWRRMRVNEFNLSGNKLNPSNLRKELAEQKSVIITPIISPPDRKSVEAWLKAKKCREQNTKKEDLIAQNSKSSKSRIKEEKILEDEVSQLKNTRSQEMFTSEELNEAAIDPFVQKLLDNSKLFKDHDGTKLARFSCGQIESLSDSTRSNVDNENLQNVKAVTAHQYITVFSLEAHINTRGDLLPDVQYDSIGGVFYAIQNDVPPTSNIKPLDFGAIVVDFKRSKNSYNYCDTQCPVTYVESEEALLNTIISLVNRYDPEILIGWDVEIYSWGYISQRALHLGINFISRISRIPKTNLNKWEAQMPDFEALAEIKLPGRIVLEIWRIMRHEIALLTYTFENVMYHILNERLPAPSFKVLTQWWAYSNSRLRWRVIDHYIAKVLGILRMLDHLDIIGRTSEHARLYGIQFYEVFSRGSQFRVESMMLRLAKPLNYIPVSPSSHQRACMRAPESLPLIMEPESVFYSDPLVVLDFQSLYPSIIIAYNYCFSTCLGRVEHIGSPHPFDFGAYTLKVPKNLALKLEGKINFSPCGVAFVKSDVRKGILPRMLSEILNTRLMVKKAMKDHSQNDKTLQRSLHSRQLGLKLIANVTYGYTAANFSGRMPCIEVGDSVVSKGKETLERAIKLVEATPKWGARVVYGDTDSLFILLPGKSRTEAFKIGAEMADAVTAANPPPVKLKFEKVLHPSILQTKKRYCGYMYENIDDEPVYLGKGIETVRRDGCPAVSKILEKSLKILFDTKDMSLVKKYVTKQLDNVLTGRASIQDLTFAREFRGLKGYAATACVPALELTRRLMQKDPRAIPRSGERVRYVIVAGAPNETLIRCVRSPMELIADPSLHPNAIYYITRVIIPPLNRCFNLMGVDVHAWFMEMPHRQILSKGITVSNKQKSTIAQYFTNITCPSCGQQSQKGICSNCAAHPSQTVLVIQEKIRQLERTNYNFRMICQSCTGMADVESCTSLDCPIFYRRMQSERDAKQADDLCKIIHEMKLDF